MAHIKRIDEMVGAGIPTPKPKPQWKPDEYITWEEYQYFCNHSADFFDRNWEKAKRNNVPDEWCCSCCHAEISKERANYQYMKYKDVNGSTAWFYNDSVDGETVRVGNSCFKYLQAAHKQKYGY